MRGAMARGYTDEEAYGEVIGSMAIREENMQE